MSILKIQSVATAPEGAQPILKSAERAMGFVPNLYGVLANSSTALKAYTQLSELLDKSSLTKTELQIVLIEVSIENGCEYCVAAHTAIASMQKVPSDVVEAIRLRRELADPKLEALRRFARAVVTERGWVPDEEREAFFAAGYAEEQILDVITAVAMKTISNYTNHLASTPLDAAFAPASWTADQAA
jgi:uncharacterized peroxidase-related enzyme